MGPFHLFKHFKTCLISQGEPELKHTSSKKYTNFSQIPGRKII